MHEQKTDEHRERQRDSDDEDRAEVREEEDVCERDEQKLFYESLLQRVRRALDELRAVVEWDDLCARGQARLQLLDAALDALDHVERVDAVARDDDAAHRFFTVAVERARAEGVAEFH